MLIGVKGLFRSTKALTLVEILLSVLLLGFIFLAVSYFYVVSQRFYVSANDKVMIGYELQYALQHISENVITGIGDKNNPAIEIESGNLEFTVRHIEETDPGQSPTYGEYNDDTEVGYKIDSDTKELLFNSDVDGEDWESLVPQIEILASDSSFSFDGNVFIIKLTGESKMARAGAKQRLTLYSACYPRLNAFQ